MQIYINRNAEQLGPFEEVVVTGMLHSGQLQTNDLLVREGETDWKSIAQFFPNIASSTVTKKGSAFGVVMMIFGILGSLPFGLFSLLAFFSIDQRNNPYMVRYYTMWSGIFFVILLGFLLISLIGLVMNVVAKRKNRTTAK